MYGFVTWRKWQHTSAIGVSTDDWKIIELKNITIPNARFIGSGPIQIIIWCWQPCFAGDLANQAGFMVEVDSHSAGIKL